MTVHEVREERDCHVARGRKESGSDDDAEDDAGIEGEAATVAGDEIVT